MYAHCKIEDHRDGRIINPGEEVPDDLPGLDEMIEWSEQNPNNPTVSEEPYEAPKSVGAPVVDIDGETYVKADDVKTKIAEAKERFARDEITLDQFEQEVADAVGVTAVSSGDNGEGGDNR